LKKIVRTSIILSIACLFSQLNLFAQISLDTFCIGFTKPVDIANCGDSRLFIAEQPGRIFMCDSTGVKNPVPFLNYATHVNSTGLEKGLLSMVFAPDYLTSGCFYVYYTPITGGVSRISRFRVSSNPNLADTMSEQIIIDIPQPVGSHYGGDMSFGKDGYLYISLGDGGGEGDPSNHAQDTALWLGKFLRMDVSDTSLAGYSIPPDNPFLSGPYRSEVWSVGFRNPWRWSFDRLTHDMWIGDVGQGQREEIDFQPAGSMGGENYGWRCMEGSLVYNAATCNAAITYIPPAYEYPHTSGCSVTGGFVYRGSSYHSMFGKYFYGDWCNTSIHYLVRSDSGTVTETNLGNLGAGGVIAFGEDRWGDLYTSNYSGSVFKFVDTSAHHVAFISSEDTIHLCGQSSYMLNTPPGPGFHYAWYRNGIVLPGDSAGITITQSGNYYVNVFNASAELQTSDTVYISFDVLPVVAINNPDTVYCTSQTDVLIHVSPAGGTLWIDLAIDTTFVLHPALLDTGMHTITYSYTDSNGCSNSVSQNISIEECVSVKESEAQSIILYPVPADDKLFLKTGNLFPEKIEILDVIGRKILSLKNVRAENNFEIDISGISSGVYFLKVNAGKNVLTKKIIIE
jgi:glucose/arabinose dehydrogenase